MGELATKLVCTNGHMHFVWTTLGHVVVTIGCLIAGVMIGALVMAGRS